MLKASRGNLQWVARFILSLSWLHGVPSCYGGATWLATTWVSIDSAVLSVSPGIPHRCTEYWIARNFMLLIFGSRPSLAVDHRIPQTQSNFHLLLSFPLLSGQAEWWAWYNIKHYKLFKTVADLFLEYWIPLYILKGAHFQQEETVSCYITVPYCTWRE